MEKVMYEPEEGSAVEVRQGVEHGANTALIGARGDTGPLLCLQWSLCWFSVDAVCLSQGKPFRR